MRHPRQRIRSSHRQRIVRSTLTEQVARRHLRLWASSLNGGNLLMLDVCLTFGEIFNCSHLAPTCQHLSDSVEGDFLGDLVAGQVRAPFDVGELQRAFEVPLAAVNARPGLLAAPPRIINDRAN